jgi:hypothetical protein
MTLNELLPSLRALPRTEKLRLIQVLAADIAREEDLALSDTGSPYPVWSPHEAFDGAATLLRVLEEDKAAS